MSESNASSMPRIVGGTLLLLVGVAVFAIRLRHAGAYAVPTPGVLIGGLGAIAIGVVLLWRASPRSAVLLAGVASPVVLYFALYATLAEVEEVVSLYAIDPDGRPTDLRLWIVDREDGAWVGMPRAKALEHGLDGARLELLRDGSVRCVVPALVEDRETVGEIHARKVEKYAVARAAAAIGLYPREATENAVSLRLDPCP
ncbi:MAG: hypothetical protein R3E53_00415 [Myxococcota bacterium]